MQKILVSRCLLGEPVRYDGGTHGPFALLEAWRRQGRLVAVCPEVAGGLPTPRPPAEIPGGQGARVLDGECGVVTIDGAEVGAAFLVGARAALQLVKAHGIRLAVLKARSPSCGNRENYDGSFGGLRVPGEGVTAALLRRHGVLVFSEEDLEAAAAALAALEAGGGVA
ncbi:2-thiouracil desulfurase family protein [Azotobacter armeniacus]